MCWEMGAPRTTIDLFYPGLTEGEHTPHMQLTFTVGWAPLCSNCSSTHNWSRTGDRSEGTTHSHHLRGGGGSTNTSTHHRRAALASSTQHTTQHLHSTHNTCTLTWSPPPRTDTILSVSSSTVCFVSKWPKTSNRVFQVTLLPCSNQ